MMCLPPCVGSAYAIDCCSPPHNLVAASPGCKIRIDLFVVLLEAVLYNKRIYSPLLPLGVPPKCCNHPVEKHRVGGTAGLPTPHYILKGGSFSIRHDREHAPTSEGFKFVTSVHRISTCGRTQC